KHQVYVSQYLFYTLNMERILYNRKSDFNYEIIKKLTAGIELFGFEVKSLKNKHGSLEGSYVIIDNNEVFLINARIPAYQPMNTPKDYDPYRKRKLLLHKEEIKKLIGINEQKGLTMVPISVYNVGKKLKVEIAVARGKKKYDKRETIKKRDNDRDIRRTLTSK
ncbi:MAG: SsrA-binding protein SmpB, partial [Patescibacteria group bacterium]